MMKKRLQNVCLLLFVAAFGTMQSQAQNLAHASASLANGTPKRVQKELTLKKPTAAAVAIKGTITSEKGEPLVGASVVVKGTSIGTLTDVDGHYELSVPDAATTLTISYVGYDTQEIIVGNRTTIDIQLTEGKALGEVIVVGYGTVKKSDVTGSVSSITSKELEKIPATNILQAMQGQAAGIDIVQTNARPGAFSQIRIRGNRSLNATNNPLFVLDGIPLSEGASINDFNPTDIESIEILKDASATAIYGSRGANGVVLITSKKAKKGRTSITYNGSMGLSNALVPFGVLSGAEFAELRREGKRGNAATSYNSAFPNPEMDYANFNTDLNMWESVSQAYTWIDKTARIAQKRPATAEEKARMAAYQAFNSKFALSDSVFMYDASKVRNTNWGDLVTQTGREQNHQIGITGGTDKMSVSFSFGYLDKQGIQQGQGYQRLSTRLALDWSVNDWLKIGAEIIVSMAKPFAKN